MWRFDVKTLRMLTLTNDAGAFLTCFPNYAMLMLPALRSFVGFNGTPSKVAIEEAQIEQKADEVLTEN